MHLTFIDSFQFMCSILERLDGNLDSDKLRYIELDFFKLINNYVLRKTVENLLEKTG